jgi:hypothetical protein
MKPKFYALLLGAVALLTFNTASAFTSLVVISKPDAASIKDPNPLSLITPKQFLTLTPQKFQELTGKKMNLVQKLELKILQHKVKKMLKKGKDVTMADVIKRFEDDSLMNVLGFLLGAILGPIGVIVALILKESGDMSQTAFRWSLIGMLIWLVWFFIVIL